MPSIKRISSATAFTGHFLKIQRDLIELPNGHQCTMEMVLHPGASAIVPIDDKGNVILVEQIRTSTHGWLVEVPAGTLEAGENPQICAHRELEEETGMRAGNLTSLGYVWASPGYSNEKIALYLATDLQTSQQHLDDEEVLHVVRMPLEEAVQAALRGDITDSKSICALLRAHRLLQSVEGGAYLMD